MNKYILFLFAHTMVNCSQEIINRSLVESLPKELYRIILLPSNHLQYYEKNIEDLSYINECNSADCKVLNKILKHKKNDALQCHFTALDDLTKDTDFLAIKDIVAFSVANKYLYAELNLKLVKPYIQVPNFLFLVIEKNLNMTFKLYRAYNTPNMLIDCQTSSIINGNLAALINLGKPLFQCMVRNSYEKINKIVTEFLPLLLKSPDDYWQNVDEGLFEPYGKAMFFILHYTFMYKPNGFVFCTNEKVETDHKLIHGRLNIVVQCAGKNEQGIPCYKVTQKYNLKTDEEIKKIEKQNYGYVFTKNGKKVDCVIS